MAVWRGRNRDRRGENIFDGGINNGQSSFNIKDSESTDEYGWDFENYPALKTRKGRTTYGTSGGAVTRLLVNYKNSHLVRAVGTKIQRHNGTDWADVTTGLTDADWSGVNYRDTLILTNGTDNVKSYNGTTLSDLNAVSAPKGKYVTQYANRIYILKDRTLSYSALGIPSDFTTVDDAGELTMSTPNGELGTGLFNYHDHVLAFSQNYYCKLYGTGPDNYELIDGSNGIGCCSFKTIQEVGDTLFWLDERGVYAFQGGAPTRISQPIQSYINDLNPAQLEKCFGGADNLRYYLGLVTGDNTEPNILLVFDLKWRKWRVNSLTSDLRYSANLNNRWYVGGSSGKTYLMNEGTDDDGTAISYMVTSKPFNEDMAEAHKEYCEIHMQGTFPSGSTLSVGVSTDDVGSSFTSIDYDPVTASSATQSKNLIVPLDTVPLAYWMRYKISGTGQVEIVSVQRYFRVQPVMH